MYDRMAEEASVNDRRRGHCRNERHGTQPKSTLVQNRVPEGNYSHWINTLNIRLILAHAANVRFKSALRHDEREHSGTEWPTTTASGSVGHSAKAQP